MSRIPFLDNVYPGENNFWRYFFTIILTWGAPVVLGIVILLFVMTYLLTMGVVDLNFIVGSFTSDPLTFMLFIGLTYVISMVFFYIGVRYIHKRKFLSIITIESRFNWKRLFKGGLVWLVLLTVGLIISLILEPSSIEFNFNLTPFILMFVLCLLIFPIQASFEELFFRGYLMQGFGLLTKKPVVLLIITSLIFSLPHYFNGSYTTLSVDIVLQAFILGLTLGIIVLGENGLETAMGVHIFNNIFATVIVNHPDDIGLNMPSLFTSLATPDPVIDTLGIIVYALVLLAIIFWGKKEDLLRIFRSDNSVEE
jgi:membrane protease YdiL (CAAX protease family)